MYHMVMILSIFFILAVPHTSFSETENEFRATIEGVQIRDNGGSLIGSGEIGEPILIQSPITINKVEGYEDELQKYTYYAQIKVAEKDVCGTASMKKIDRIITIWYIDNLHDTSLNQHHVI